MEVSILKISQFNINKYLNYNIVMLSIILAIFHIYTGLHGLMYTYIQRGIHLGLILVITILSYINNEKRLIYKILNILLLIATVISFLHLFINMDYIMYRLWGTPLTLMDIITGVFLFLVVLIIGIKKIGFPLPIIMLLSIAYGLFGQYLSGIFQHGGYSIKFMIELLTWSEMGIFSQPLGVSATYLYMFVLFGTLIDKMGTGSTLMDMSKIIAGKHKGGPAKVAIFSSALMGTISGSPTANVLTTGTFTIPLMTKLGFEKSYAGAVEAVASTGGMILPPVMGVLVFAMVDYSGIPYTNIILAAAIPAILYYLAVFVTLHLHSCKLNINAMDVSSLGTLKDLLKKRWSTLVPIFVLVVPLVIGFTPLITVSWAILSLLPISLLNRNRKQRLTHRRLIEAFADAARNISMVAVPCAIAGIVSGVLGVTGVGVRISSILVQIANGNLLVLLILIAFITIIMGTGLPALLAYLIQIPVTIPALVQMGIPLMGAHLFVVYYSTLSFITPPVGPALYAAMAISKSTLGKIGKCAIIIGISAFLIPFMFIYNPQLLLLEAFDINTFKVILTSVTGVICLSIASEGYLFKKISIPLRALFLISSILLISPNTFVGMLIIPLVLFISILIKNACKCR